MGLEHFAGIYLGIGVLAFGLVMLLNRRKRRVFMTYPSAGLKVGVGVLSVLLWWMLLFDMVRYKRK